MLHRPISLEPLFLEKVWGSTHLSPWFADADRKIGEVWFTGDNHQAGAASPLLIKFLFTSEKLSVQVHPDDDYAREQEDSRGKTEMWHILRAEPGATVAIGFKEKLSPAQVREAALSGSIEQLLNWVPVVRGDTIFTPAGTVHAIGGGVALCEIQQNSDVTYRLYDYGRPRELHLDKALSVAHLGPHVEPDKPSSPHPDREVLAHCDHFATESWTLTNHTEVPADPDSPQFLVVLEGAGRLGECAIRPGEVWFLPASSEPVMIQPEAPLHLLRTYPNPTQEPHQLRRAGSAPG